MTAVLTLSLGIGATAAIFSVADAVLFRDLPYKDPDSLVVALFGGENPASPADYFDWKTQNNVFEQISAAEFWTPNLTGRDQPEQLWGVRVDDNLFDMLGVAAALGRTFTEAEATADGAPFVVLSDKLWRRRFGGDAGVVNQTLTMDGRVYQILGVMPAGFEFPLFWATRAELWSPLPLGNRRNSTSQSLRLFARLKSGVTLQQARSEMDVLTKRMAENRPSLRREASVEVIPLHEKVVRNVQSSVLALLLAVGFVLLIGCANVANLLLARGNIRRREFAVRSALGATGRRLAAQLLSESAALAVLSGILGLGLAYAGLWLLSITLPADLLPRQQAVGIDSTVLAFVMTVSIVASLVFGSFPAFQAARSDINESLKSVRSTAGHRSQWRRRALVIAEVSLALVLLIGAGLTFRSFTRLEALNPGFTTTDVLTMTVSVAGTNQSPPERRKQFYEDIVDRTKALGGVESTSLINHLPLAGDIWSYPFTVEGQAVAKPEDQPSAAYRVVYSDYFRTMQIQLRGRDFDTRDNATAPAVVIVNEAMVRRYFPNQDPIGKLIKIGGVASPFPWMSIVGVVPAVKQSGWTDRVGSEMYVPLLQSSQFLSNPAPHFSYMTLVVRGGADVPKLTGSIRSEIGKLEPNAAVSNVATMEEVMRDKISRPRTAAILSLAFGAIGLVLTMIGVYGVMSYSVSTRTHEIGLRTALGARSIDIMRFILREGMILAGAGIVIGVVAALALTRLMQAVLFEVSPTDPLTFIGVVLIVTSVAIIASYIPARRAVRVDPLVALRED